MGADQFLDYEIALLLAKYGGKRVVTALARGLELPEERLQAKLTEVNKLKPHASGRKRVDSSAVLDTIAAEHPEKISDLRLLLTRYENKTFLPELKDVRRFFARYSHPLRGIKSRTDSVPQLFSLLATLDVSELKKLTESIPEKEYSSLGIISEEIMRRAK